MIRAIFLLLAGTAMHLAAASQICPVIPMPGRATAAGGQFPLSDATVIVAMDPSLNASAHMLQQQLLRYAGVRATIQPKAGANTITLKRVKNTSPEAYTLQMTERSVEISAAGDVGIFYGISSLVQLARGKKTAPCWNIQDAPLYKWRGFMLDESRHFFGKAEVKKILDEMALYKLNRFHWHLTDGTGWRIEIKQYPRLTLVGGIGVHGDANAPSQFYTQGDIEDIVAYAAARQITVIPEIDMPGHAMAANRSYPEFSGGGSKNYPDFTFNPGKESVYQYLSNILKEVDVMFPSQMIHIGGDEVSFGSEAWNSDADVQQLMKKEKLATLVDVEHYFLRRIADTLRKLNNDLAGWDEIATSGLPAQNTVMFWWRHDKPEQLTTAVQKGYRIVLCPRLPFYFDFVQDSTHLKGRRWYQGGLYNSVKDVYDYSLKGLPEAVQNSKLVEGIQANLWTETVASKERLDFMIFPRMLAFAEAAWTQPNLKDYTKFEQRLKAILPLMDKQGVYYYNVLDAKQSPEMIY